VWSSDETVSIAADTRPTTECSVGSGFGVISDNLINIGRAMGKKAAP
jgi:hypothetical protein